MKRGVVFEGPVRFMDRERRNNLYFFQDCSVNRQSAPMAFIPFENPGTFELGRADRHCASGNLYNPTPGVRSATSAIPPAQKRKVRLSENGKTVEGTLRASGRAIVRSSAGY